MLPVPLDEYPIHQAPVSMRYVPTSDRNFYDRCYFNAHDRTGDIFLVTGLGVYPNLGVIDAYATVRKGDHQWAIRMSDALTDRSMDVEVGPYRIEVQEPLQRVRLLCDGSDHGIGFDLTWEGSFAAVMEQHHVMRTGPRAILDAARFAQVGTWEGVLDVGGSEHVVSPDRWVGTRDRSWGIRPVGEAEPPGRNADEPLEGFWWLYVPLRFDDFAVVLIAQELPDGFRTLNDASRIWSDGRVEQLGWPEVEIHYRSGTRHPERAVLHLSSAGRQAVRHRGGDARFGRAPCRRRLRRRPGLVARAVARPRLRRGRRVRPQRSRDRRPHPVRGDRPRGPGHL